MSAEVANPAAPLGGTAQGMRKNGEFYATLLPQFKLT